MTIKKWLETRAGKARYGVQSTQPQQAAQQPVTQDGFQYPLRQAYQPQQWGFNFDPAQGKQAPQSGRDLSPVELQAIGASMGQQYGTNERPYPEQVQSTMAMPSYDEQLQGGYGQGPTSIDGMSHGRQTGIVGRESQSANVQQQTPKQDGGAQKVSKPVSPKSGGSAPKKESPTSPKAKAEGIKSKAKVSNDSVAKKTPIDATPKSTKKAEKTAPKASKSPAKKPDITKVATKPKAKTSVTTTTTKKPASKSTASSATYKDGRNKAAFDKKFASERAKGSKVFDFEGKSYNTRRADDKKAGTKESGISAPKSKPGMAKLDASPLAKSKAKLAEAKEIRSKASDDVKTARKQKRQDAGDKRKADRTKRKDIRKAKRAKLSPKK